VPVAVDNRGVPGATSEDLLSGLGTADEASSVGAADVVLVTIGANDFGDQANAVVTHRCGGSDNLACVRSGLDTLRDNMHAIVQRIRALRGGRDTVILVSGYWNVYEDGSVADHDYGTKGRVESDRLTLAVNDVIQRQAEQAGTTYVDLVTPFKGPRGGEDPSDVLADDGDHPNAAGHQLIAQTLVRAGTAPLPPP
jgi:lysophospholipase L1-like esterase